MNLSRLALSSASRIRALETSFGSLQLQANQQQRFFSKEPVRQKPPPTAFLLFYKSKLPEIKEMHKDSPNKVTQWSKTAGQMWKELDENGKKRFHDIFEERKKEYLSTVSEQDLMDRKKAATEKRMKNVKRKQKNEAKSLDKPKKPPSAHGLYIREQTAMLESKGDMKKAFVKISHDWKLLDESQKERFVKDAEGLKQVWDKELRSWEDEQIENGRKHLVRNMRLKQLDLIPKPKKTTDKKSVKTKEVKPKKAEKKV